MSDAPTPATLAAVCRAAGLLPLDFDGVHDALYHPFDRAGNRHMEYVRQRGSFDDVPLAQIVAGFRETYGDGLGSAAAPGTLHRADFLQDVDRETAAGG